MHSHQLVWTPPLPGVSAVTLLTLHSATKQETTAGQRGLSLQQSQESIFLTSRTSGISTSTTALTLQTPWQQADMMQKHSSERDRLCSIRTETGNSSHSQQT